VAPELERLASLVDEQPSEAREALQVRLVVAPAENGGARLVNTARVDGRTWYSYETVAGDVFSVVRPEMGAEAERAGRERLVKLMEEESADHP
jgi:hypothetical protein